MKGFKRQARLRVTLGAMAFAAGLSSGDAAAAVIEGVVLSSRGPTARGSSVTSGCEPSGGEAVAGRAPLVTVVTPSFQYARFLPACLDSVRRQTYPRIEHLVLDHLPEGDLIKELL